MAISHKNGIALSAIASVMAVAIGSISGFAGEAVSAPPPSGSPTAPSPVGSAVGNYVSGSTADVTQNITGLVAGNLLVAVVSTYLNSTLIDPTVSAPGYTWTARGPLVTIGGDVGFRVYTAPIPSNGSVTVTSSNAGNYKSLVLQQMQNVDAAVVDVTPVSRVFYEGGTTPFPITLGATTYTHDFIFAAFGWYTSDLILGVDAAWPALFQWNAGQDDRNQIILVGKQVTATGTYAPQIIANSVGTDIGGIAIAFKGKAV